MRRLCGLLFLSLVLGVWPAQAEGLDDQYIAIYSLIQQGDVLNNAGRSTEALAKYTAARSQLETFQRLYSGWNPKVVTFRMTYLEAKIAALKVAAVGGNAPGVSKAATPAAPPPTEAEQQLKAVREQIKELQADRANLEAKLKEAFAAQPAAVDPRELAQAQKRIESLMKENDLLKVSLTNPPSGTDTAAATKAMEELKRTLAETSQQLAGQTERADKLAAEKAELLSRLDGLVSQTNTSSAVTAKALEELRQTLVIQTERADKLALEKADLQSRLDSLASQTNLLAELEMVKRELVAANQQLAEQTNLAAQRTQERNTLQGRVDTLLASAAAAEAIRTENELLKKQVAESKALEYKSLEQGKKLAEVESRSMALQSEVGILRLEKSALQDRVKQAPAPVKSRPEDLARIRQLERERDDLQKKLELAGRKPAAPAAAPVKSVVVSEKELTAQVAVLRARVDVLEAKPVPYTREELALFKNPPVRPAAVAKAKPETKTKPDAKAKPDAKPEAKPEARPDAKPVNQLPAGTATLATEAQKHFAARNYTKAEEKYLEILRRDENNAYTLANLATIQLEMNHLDDADKNISQAVAIAPDDAYNMAVLGFLKFRQAKYDDALDALSRASSLNPQNAEVQNYLGVTLSHKGLRAQAETALRKALQIDSNYGDAHNNLAVIYATQTPPLLELARWHYQKALAAGMPQNMELEKMLKAR